LSDPVYTVRIGETWEIIARKVYGAEERVDVLRSANPGQPAQPTPFTILLTPELPNSPIAFTADPPLIDLGDTPNQVTILIDNKEFREWTTVNVTSDVGKFKTATFTTPFEAEIIDFKEIFRPLAFKQISIYVGGSRIFRGRMVKIDPVITPDSKILNVSCYSLPGVLQDCTLPPSVYPLQFLEEPNLKQIADRVCKPFGISVVQAVDVGSAFEEVTCGVSSKVFSFLSGLAKERGVLLSDTDDGELLLQTGALDGNPVAILKQGESPLISIAQDFKPQSMFTHITAVGNYYAGDGDGTSSVINHGTLFTNSFRPMTYTLSDTRQGQVQTAAIAEYGRMLANVINYNVEVTGWRDPDGDLWSPNSIIQIEAPDAMIYKPYNFMIKSVSFSKTSDKDVTSMVLTLPGLLAGVIPSIDSVTLPFELFPWED